MNATQQVHQNSPTYWFAILDIALSRRDLQAAARARSELLRLGVAVEFIANSEKRKAVAHA